MRFFCGLFLCLLAAVPAHAETQFPAGPVRIVVTGGPGAGGDTLARLLAQKLSEKWKQPVAVDNKSGGGGQVSANEVLRSPADGYTLFISNDAPAIAPLAIKNLKFDYRTAFEPISLLVLIDFKLLVRKDMPAKNVGELIAYGKANPGKLTFASAGVFTSHHLMSELLMSQTGFEAVHVPYVGAVPAITSLAAGRADFAFAGFTGLDGFLQTGQVREIATTGKQRNAATPNLPTIGETVPNFSAYSWFAMWTRAEVPADIRAKIATDVAAFMKEPDMVQRMAGNGMTAIGSTPEELRAHLNTEKAKWESLPAKVIAGAN